MSGFDFTIKDGNVTWEPWTNGYAVGFKLTHTDGRVEHIYLNPSQNEYNDDAEPDDINAFLYTAGADPEDGAAHHYYQMMETS